jgi:hypothetical protein
VARLSQPHHNQPQVIRVGVEILQTASDPKIELVTVTGLVSSEGWGFPQLVPTYRGKPFDDVLDLQFIATAPAQPQLASGFVVVSAIFPLDPDHRFKVVRVRAAENAISVLQIPGNNRAVTQVNDCKTCLGKRFVSSGQAQPGDQGVVRQEVLPKAPWVLQPSDGIRGADPDPDRLTLVTDDNGTVVEAFGSNEQTLVRTRRLAAPDHRRCLPLAGHWCCGRFGASSGACRHDAPATLG